MRTAVGISLLSCVEAEFVLLNLQSRHLGFLTSAYLLPVHQHQYNTHGTSVSDNVWFADAIMLLTEDVLTCYIRRLLVLSFTSGFEPPYWLAVSTRLVLIPLFRSPAIFMEIHRSVSANS